MMQLLKHRPLAYHFTMHFLKHRPLAYHFTMPSSNTGPWPIILRCTSSNTGPLCWKTTGSVVKCSNARWLAGALAHSWIDTRCVFCSFTFPHKKTYRRKSASHLLWSTVEKVSNEICLVEGPKSRTKYYFLSSTNTGYQSYSSSYTLFSLSLT